MADYVLSCCSTADLSNEWYDVHDVGHLYFHLTVGEREYDDNIGVTISHKEMFDKMLAGESAKSSQVTLGEYMEYFDSILSQGKDLIHVCLSSGISGSYNSAMFAYEEMKQKYPDRKIYVIDSLCASSGFGLLMMYMVERRDAGMDIDELAKWAEEYKHNLHHWFFSTDLTFFIKGGRISKTAGAIGQVLNICPLMDVDQEGKLQVREKIRGKKNVIKKIVERMAEHATDGYEYSGKCIISSTDDEAAAQVKELIENKFPRISGEIVIYPIGGTISVHTGPGTVALFFMGDERV